jgi:hypothetical protein
MVFYKMGRAGLLEGLPDTVDMSNGWQIVAVTDDVKANAFQPKFGVPLTAKFRHMPESFARLLAKIGYCNLLTMLDPADFRPICLPYILGDRKNPSYVVGGAVEIAEPETVGYRLSTLGFGSPERQVRGTGSERLRSVRQTSVICPLALEGRPTRLTVPDRCRQAS